MKKRCGLCAFLLVLVLCPALTALAGNGYMGGKGTVAVEEEPPSDTGGDGGMPSDIEGPLNDQMSASGKLFGDLYVILRQTGVEGDRKLMPEVDGAGEPVLKNGYQSFVVVENTSTNPDAVVGGEPVLTVIDPGAVNDLSDYGWYAVEVGINPEDGTPIYEAAQAPYPAQCVQPVASYERWGDISSKTGLTKNRLPLVITYDATWNRSECEVNQVSGKVTADPVTGELTIPVNKWFIEPGGQWYHPKMEKVVTYPDGVLWTDLVQEVGFGRLNIGRSPEAVLQAAFDEAVNNLNSPDTIAIEIDAAGRLLLTNNVYDPFLVEPETGKPLYIGTVKKAIDSPLENVALYVKLMKDGHLVTPGDEREPIDRSNNGGIPIWKMLELEDGPAAAALRPTINIAKLRNWGLGNLVDVSETTYYTYYRCLDANGGVTPCLCWDTDPVQPELDGEWVACPEVADRVLTAVSKCPGGVNCEGPFTGILTDDGGKPNANNFGFAASFLAAAADKTGHIGLDMVVYLNSILGINKVVGTNEEGTVDYSKHPVYFNYRNLAGYSRDATFPYRGQVVVSGGCGTASSYDGNVIVLQQGGTTGAWNETKLPILSEKLPLDNVGWSMKDGLVMNTFEAHNILGFTQQADDDLSVIRFIHTYQIPELR